MTKSDYYQILGLKRTATQEEIKKAYRKMAKKYHPDTAGNDKQAEQRFKEVKDAYDVLHDPEKRKMYDRFGHAAPNTGPGPQSGGPGAYRTYTWHAGPDASNAGGVDFDFSDLFGTGAPGGAESIFERMAGQRRQRPTRRPQPTKAADIQHTVQIDFFEAVNGTHKDIVLTTAGPGGPRNQEKLSVKIPAGIHHGGKIRLKGKGQPSTQGSPGDLILTIHVADHPWFRRDQNDIYLDVPLTFEEAALGAKIEVPTLSGTHKVTVPPGSSSGQKLRIKGKGIQTKDPAHTGDMFLNLKIISPRNIDDDSKKSLREFAKKNPQNDIRNLWK